MANQDLVKPDFYELRLYRSLAELQQWCDALAAADAVVVGSFVPDAIQLIEWLRRSRAGILGFYDIDTPVTLCMLAKAGERRAHEPAALLADPAQSRLRRCA